MNFEQPDRVVLVRNHQPESSHRLAGIPKPATDYGRWRVVSLVVVHLLIALHITHWLMAGRTLAPLEFNEVLHTVHAGVLTAGCVFMLVTVVGTLLAGRFFCSWGCHILALQDLSAWILRKLRIRPIPIRSRTLRWVPTLAVVYLFLWPAVVRWWSGAGLPKIRVQSDGEGWGSFVTNHFWRNLPGPGMTLLTFAVVGGVIVYFLGTRSFCRYVCPYGALFSWADRLAPGKIKLVADCSQCGLCTAQCQSQILVHREVALFGRVVNPQCLKDLDCVTVCPNQALSYGWGRPSLGLSLPEGERAAQPNTFTRAEELALAGMTMVLVWVFRGLYDSVPFLLAVALACLVSCLMVLGVRMVYRPTVWLSRARLKSEGHWRWPGYAWAVILAIFVGFSLHSGWVHYHTKVGRKALGRVIPSAKPGFPRSSSPNQVEIGQLSLARAHLERAESAGLWASTQLRHDLATVYGLAGDIPALEAQLRRIQAADPDDLAAEVRLGRMLVSERRMKDARPLLHSLIGRSVARFGPLEFGLRSEALVLLGRVEEQESRAEHALRCYEEAERDDPTNGEAGLARGTLLARLGRFDEADAPLRRAADHYPDPSVVWENQAIVSLKLRRYEEAIDRLSQLLRLNPNRTRTRYHLGVALFEAGRSVEAAEHFREVLVLDPAYEPARAALAQAELRRSILPPSSQKGTVV